jgi:predicted enzyme related to lactoylglutathione lyase
LIAGCPNCFWSQLLVGKVGAAIPRALLRGVGLRLILRSHPDDTMEVRMPTRRKPRTRTSSRRTASKTARKRARARAAARPGRKSASKRPTRPRTPSRPRPRSSTTPAAPRTRTGKPLAAAASSPNAIGFVTQHMDYTSHDVEAVRRFYVDLLGFTDARHDLSNDYLSIRTGATSSLGFMPPVPGPPEQWRPPREPVIYLRVGDVDRAHLDLLAKGVSFEQGPTDMPWGHRVAILKDPEGRTVYLAQWPAF